MRLASAPKAGRNKARWEMVKYYLGQGLISSAAGVLQLMEESDSRAAKDPKFRAVRGLVYLFQNRLREAEIDLFNVNLRLYPDVGIAGRRYLAGRGTVARGYILARSTLGLGRFDHGNPVGPTLAGRGETQFHRTKPSGAAGGQLLHGRRQRIHQGPEPPLWRQNEQGSHAETFRVLTHKVDQSQTKFRDLAGQIVRVADLEAFMASYRNKVKNGGLSAIN